MAVHVCITQFYPEIPPTKMLIINLLIFHAKTMTNILFRNNIIYVVVPLLLTSEIGSWFLWDLLCSVAYSSDEPPFSKSSTYFPCIQLSHFNSRI